MNPIEKVWANLKRLIRVHPQKEQDLDTAIEERFYKSFVY
jgi:transposase